MSHHGDLRKKLPLGACHSEVGAEDGIFRSRGPGARPIPITEKARYYHSAMESLKLNRIFKKLKVSMDSADNLVKAKASPNDVREEYKIWLKHFAEFMDACDSVHDILTLEAKQINEARLGDLKVFKSNVEQYFLTEDVVPEDSVSQAIKTSPKARSRKSSSIASSASKLRLAEIEKNAELTAQMATLEAKQKLEAAQLELNQKVEIHKLQTSLIASQVKSEALEAFENEDGGSVAQAPPVVNIKPSLVSFGRVPLRPMADARPKQIEPRNLFSLPAKQPTPPAAPEPVSTPYFVLPRPDQVKSTNVLTSTPVTVNNVSEHVDHTPVSVHNTDPNVSAMPVDSTPLSVLADTTSAHKEIIDYIASKNDDLPAKEPQVFKGDVFQFPLWLQSFETLVEKKRREAKDRLYYLGVYTSGPPHEAIEGYLILDTDEAYTEAKDTLVDRYGNKLMVAESYKKRLNSWPNLKNATGPELRKFVDFLKACRTAMSSLGYLSTLDSVEENRKLLQKLPRFMVNKWNCEADRRMYGKAATYSGADRQFPPFADFVTFMIQEVRLANSVLVFREEETTVKPDKPRAKNNRGARSFASETKEVQCPVCKEAHSIQQCSTFCRMPLTEKQTVMKANALCYGCLAPGHMKRACRNKSTCDKCNRQHPTLLHDDNYKPRKSTHDTMPTVTSHCLNCNDNPEHACFHSLILPVELYHSDNPNVKVTVYALIDEQSDACFVTNQALEQLDITGTPVELRLSTVLGEDVVSAQKVTHLVVRGINELMEITLPGCYSRDSIPAKETQIPHPETVKKWPHLRKVAEQLMPYNNNMDVALLIGINCVRATKPRKVINGNEDEPYAINTALGWGVIGPVLSCNNNQSQTCNTVSSHFAYKTQATEVTTQQISNMFDMGFEEHSADKVSIEDQKFIKILQDGIRYKENGHFELPLPLKNDVHLQNNKPMALKRLGGLKKKLLSDDKYRTEYSTFMKDILDKGYAEEIPANEVDTTATVWYIPHHAVFHPKKGKIRIVFDCSAEYQGQSLNHHLLQGPDMINSLTGILCRFRQESIAFTCDIEGMFHQVDVKAEHRNFLRFLWWSDDNLEHIKEYRMTVHLFGAKSSPACVNFTLKTTADTFKADYGAPAANMIKEDFYVDDGLKSVATTQEAIQLITESQQLCKRGGFRLHKLVSNDKDVIRSVRPEDRAKDIQTMDLGHDDLPVEHTLGVQWCVQSDSFQFRVDLQDKPLTRRGILSTVSSIYDPLGLLSPVILVGKQILQTLCKDGANWDDPISHEMRSRWERWRTDIKLLSTLKIPRCYKPRDFGDIASVELHHFSDASLCGLGQCSYIRLKDNQGNISTSLVMSKCKVTPSKSITVPRLELAAAVISVKVSKFLTKELNYSNITEYFWTDSKIVLGYINNEAKRFHIYVANRIQNIRDHTAPSDWRYVSSALNPADLASRGLTASELVNNDEWWNGPAFLHSDDPLPSAPTVEEPSPEDPELRKVNTLMTQVHIDTPSDLLSRLERFSTWTDAKRAVAVCQRLTAKLENRTVRKPSQPVSKKKYKENLAEYRPVSVNDMQVAEKTILLRVQQKAFPDEVNMLHRINKEDIANRDVAKHRNTTLKGSSTLYRLDPYIDEDGLMRVGGRIKRADLPRDLTNPVIIPKHGHVTKLLIEHHHVRCGHSGRGITLNSIRSSGYWIIAGSTAVTSHIWQCVTCRKLRRAPQGQKMADLPEDRLEASPPFTYSAVDYFGPFVIKEGRKEVKRYGALFTCLASRAIHIEVACAMTTDSFLNAYRRFVCRRGPVRLLRSDRGTNFVGAKGEQAAALASLDHQKICSTLLKDNCDYIDFRMNVPHASHMGGVWERMIRSARNALSALLIAHGDRLDDESLRTLLVEAEHIVNSRPLTVTDTQSPDSPVPLCPNQILTLKTKSVMPPPGTFVKEDLYLHRRWRRVQYLANEFWSRWRLEFLPTLQERKKWIRPQPNVQVDDIVMMVDDNLPRNQWPLARVIETDNDNDGFVRKVKVRTGQSTFDRPIHKLILLVDHN